MSLDPLLAASPVILLHLAAALAALAIAVIQFARPKGRALHRALGIGFVAAMALAAISALFIREIDPGHFSWIHLLVPLTLFGLVGLVRSVRAGQRRAHRRIVLMLVFGALLIPGAFAFMPGRVLHAVVTGG